jgi:predicted Zn-dependent protease
MFFCADMQSGDLATIQSAYSKLLANRVYGGLQNRADEMLSAWLKRVCRDYAGKEEQLMALADMLYRRKPEAFTAKIILLSQKKRNQMNILLLQEALTKFADDPGILKLAVEYYLAHEPAAAEKYIALFKEKFAAQKADMLRYEIIWAVRMKKFVLASELFRNNFSPEILPDYWAFVKHTMKEEDLHFLAGDEFCGPFARALLAIKNGDNVLACDLLEKADARGNLEFLFFAARILAENGRHQAALEKYALFPDDSPYRVVVLLNTAELFAETGDMAKALELSKLA